MSSIPESKDKPLFTPGPLTTSRTVKQAMLKDLGSRDFAFIQVIQEIRNGLLMLAGGVKGEYEAVPMQGSGTFAVEAVLTSTVPRDGKVLILINGAYGHRMVKICKTACIDFTSLEFPEDASPEVTPVAELLNADPAITHVAVVHCETTTGIVNPLQELGRMVRDKGRVFFVDAMSSFGGIPMDMNALAADFLISSSNKCIQGVPGFGFVIARREELEKIKGRARSLSLDLYDQWETMEKQSGRWRFTSPTHVVRAFAEALRELDEEGGIEARYARYRVNQDLLATGMEELGFRCLLPRECQSPIITAFFTPRHPLYDFKSFYNELKGRGFVVYPGKVTSTDSFRIGSIGNVFPGDIERLLQAVRESMTWEEQSVQEVFK